MVPTVPRPGTVPVYSCRAGTQMFTALSEGCEGETTVGRLGYLYSSPPPDQPSLALYRCKTSGGEHFDSIVDGCEGGVLEARLGYTIGSKILSRTARGSDHRSGTGVFPPGYRNEGTLGHLAATSEPGTAPLYSCRSGGNSFTSLSADCEGRTRIGQLGWIWSQPPQGVPYATLHRCKVTATGEHFDAVSEQCEGQTHEARLGYLRLIP
jgi:hypothetical protein